MLAEIFDFAGFQSPVGPTVDDLESVHNIEWKNSVILVKLFEVQFNIFYSEVGAATLRKYRTA